MIAPTKICTHVELQQNWFTPNIYVSHCFTSIQNYIHMQLILCRTVSPYIEPIIFTPRLDCSHLILHPCKIATIYMRLHTLQGITPDIFLGGGIFSLKFFFNYFFLLSCFTLFCFAQHCLAYFHFVLFYFALSHDITFSLSLFLVA